MKELSYSKVSDGIYVKNIYYLENKTLSKKDNKYIINSYELFKVIIQLGEDLTIGKIDDREILKQFDDYGIPITDDYVGYNIDIFFDRIKELIERLFLVISISLKCNEIIKSKNFYNEKFGTLVNDLNKFDWIMTLGSFFEANAFNLDDICALLDKPNDIKYEDKDNICYYIKHALINYINYEYSKFPIEMSLINEPDKYSLNIKSGFFKTCENILGLIYFEILNHIVSNRINITYNGCKYCGNIFRKHKNIKYCQTCRESGIPRWIKNKKYEESVKGKKTRAKYNKNIRCKKR